MTNKAQKNYAFPLMKVSDLSLCLNELSLPINAAAFKESSFSPELMDQSVNKFMECFQGCKLDFIPLTSIFRNYKGFI